MYQYQDVDDFLTEATGPWGAKSWTFDKIGNRLRGDTRQWRTETAIH